MTLRSTTSFSVRRALHLRSSSNGTHSSCRMDTGKTFTATTVRPVLRSSESLFKTGTETNQCCFLCTRRPVLNLRRKEVLSSSRHSTSSRYYHSSLSVRNYKAETPYWLRFGYHFPSRFLNRSQYLTECRFFSKLESSSPFASIHTSKQIDLDKDKDTKSKSTVFMEEEESALRETISPLLWKFLSQNPFLSSASTLKDPISYALAQCHDVEQVVAILDSNHDDIDIGRACVAVAKFWSLDTKSEGNSFIPRLVPLPSHNLLARYPSSARLLEVIGKHYMSLDDESVVCLLTYLTNIGVPTHTTVMQKLLVRTVQRIDHLDLPAMTRIFVFLRSPDLNHHVKGMFIPRLYQFLDNCTTAEQLHLINMCFVQTRRLVQDSFNLRHSEKIIELIDSGKLSDPEHTNILINTLRATLDSHNINIYEESTRKIFRLLTRRATPFNTEELTRLNVVCRIMNLNRELMIKLHDQAARDITDCQDPVRQAELFLCLGPRTLRKFSQSMEPVVTEMLDSPDYETHLLTVYLVLRLKVLENVSLISDFWDKMLALTEASLEECAKRTDDALSKEATLARTTQRYLAFNSNLSGKYRNKEVEQRLVELLLEELSRGATNMIVGRVARMASFVIAYSGPQGVPHSVIEKLQRNVDQFDIRDLLNLTTGLQISLALNSRNTRQVLVEQMVKLAYILSTVSRRIARSSTNLLALSSLVRASAVYDQVFTRFPNNAVSWGTTDNSGQLPTSNLIHEMNWDFAGLGLPNGADFNLPSHTPALETKITSSPWTSNDPFEISGSMPAGHLLTPEFNQQTPVVVEHSQTHAPKESWVAQPGVHVMQQSSSPTSSLMQLAPFLVPFTGQMSIKAAMQLSQTFAKTGFANKEVLDGVLQYLARSKAEVPGRIVGQALYTAYTLGHCSSLPHGNITTLATAITQDGSSLHGLQLLQASLSLCLYQALSRAIIASVFNVEFLDLLDEEMETSYSKPRQPQRVRQLLMEVNRGVCIDYPEAKVPWFHDQYCNDSIQTATRIKNGFRGEVQTCLSSVLGGDGTFSANTYSPYFYPLDFSFELDKDGNAVQVEPHSPLQPLMPDDLTSLPKGHTRFCVLLLNPSDYSVLQLPSSTGFQLVHQLKGQQQLKQRHLEVLGYRVISVPRHDWQSMALTTPHSKNAYMRKLIWPSEEETE